MMAKAPEFGEGSSSPATLSPDTGVPIRVVIYASHPHVLWGLDRLVCSEWPGMMLIGAASTIAELEGLLRARRVEVVLADCSDATDTALADLGRLSHGCEASFVLLSGREGQAEHLSAARIAAILRLDAPAADILGATYRAAVQSHQH